MKRMDFFLHGGDDLLKRAARVDEVAQHQRQIRFARAGALAVKDVNGLVRAAFLRQLGAQGGGVV